MFRFGVKNLRRLEHVEMLKIKPITVLVGRNSSGKSTFLRSLPLLRQSIITRTSSPILWYGDWVDFGDFDGSIIDNKSDQEMSFLFGVDNIDIERGYYVDDSGSIYLREQKKGSVNLEVEIRVAKHHVGTRITSISIKENKNLANFLIEFDVENKVQKVSIDGFDLTENLGDAEMFITAGSILPNIFVRLARDRKGTDASLRNIIQLDLFMRQKISDLLVSRLDKRIKKPTLSYLTQKLIDVEHVTKEAIKNISTVSNTRSWEKLSREISENDRFGIFPQIRRLILLSKLQNYLNAFSQRAKTIISSTLYIGPARAKSDRYYRYQDLSVSEIDPDGKNFPIFLNSLRPAEIENFSQWVRKYFKYGVSVVHESGHISIRLNYDTSTVNIVDTGYGVSQILPVLGQIWWATNRSRTVRSREAVTAPIIAIEQPELHLHPAHQAMLADAFVSSLEGTANHNREPILPLFVIETHSEALINRLGHLVAEKKLRPESVQVVVFEGDSENDRRTNARIVSFDEEGQLVDWPYGFFSSPA